MSYFEFNEPLVKGAAAYDRIASLQNKVISDSSNDILLLTVKNDKRVGLPFIFLLGTLPVLARDKDKGLILKVTGKIYRNMQRINIIDFYKNPGGKNSNTAEGQVDVQPDFVKIKDSTDIIKFATVVKMHVPLKLTEEQSAKLTSIVGEIFQNALEHARAGTVVGGKYFKNVKNRYCFTCYDDGIGIPENVNEYLKKKNSEPLNDSDAVRWALEKGHSTDYEADIPRGVGLSVIRDFVESSGGAIKICSGHCLYVLNPGKEEKFYNLQNRFIGTLFELDFISNQLF